MKRILILIILLAFTAPAWAAWGTGWDEVNFTGAGVLTSDSASVLFYFRGPAAYLDTVNSNVILPKTANTGKIGTAANAFNSIYADTGNFGKQNKTTFLDSLLMTTAKPLMFGAVRVKDTLGVRLRTMSAEAETLWLHESGGGVGRFDIQNSTRIWTGFMGLTGGLIFNSTESEGGGFMAASGADGIVINRLKTSAGPDTFPKVVVTNAIKSATDSTGTLVISGTGISSIDTSNAIATTITFSNGRIITFTTAKSGP